MNVRVLDNDITLDNYVIPKKVSITFSLEIFEKYIEFSNK